MRVLHNELVIFSHGVFLNFFYMLFRFILSLAIFSGFIFSFGVHAEVLFTAGVVSGEKKLVKYQKVAQTKEQKIQSYLKERSELKIQLDTLKAQSEKNVKEISSLNVQLSVARLSMISNPDLYRSLVLGVNKLKGKQKILLEQIDRAQARIKTLETWLKRNKVSF